MFLLQRTTQRFCTMSFRKFILIFITLLISSLLLLQWLSITRFTEDVAKQIGESAFEVSRNTAETIIFDEPKIQLRSFAFTTNNKYFNSEHVNQILSSVKKDVTIQLVDEQKDDHILLNADGSEYQIPIPRTGIHESLDRFSKNVLYSTLILLIFGILMAIYFTNKLASPLKKLQAATRKVGDGNLGVQVEKDRQWHSSEIDETLESFNLMSRKIAELQKQNSELQAKAHLAELAEISRGLAHSIRNPLNTLNLAMDQINSASSTEDKENLSKIAKQQIQRIDRWVRSLMDVMSDDKDLIRESNIDEILHNVVTDIKLFNEKNISFDLSKVQPNCATQVVEAEFKGILSSIISNAVEATPENSCVKVSLNEDNNEFRIVVEDQGKGFSEDILKKIFTPHNTNKTYGAGMGLYLAHRIIKHKYAGDIIIENKSDGGSKVEIFFKTRQS